MSQRLIIAVTIPALFVLAACEEEETGVEPTTVEREVAEPEVAVGTDTEEEGKIEEPQDIGEMNVGEENEPFVNLQDWDTDRDNELSEQEFNQGFSENVYNRWNTDDEEGWLSEDEVTTGMYGAWDRDGSGWLSENEVEQGGRSWFGTPVDYDQWDTNDDQRVDQNEMRQGLRQNQTVRGWDQNRNQRWEETEMSGPLFNYMDRDGDDAIDGAEWRWG